MSKRAWIATVPLLVIALSAFALQQQEGQEESEHPVMGGMMQDHDHQDGCPPGERMSTVGPGMRGMMGMMGQQGMMPGMGRHEGMRGHRPMMGEHRRGFRLEKMAKALDLTDDQLSRIKAIRTDQEKSAIRTRADLELAELDLRQLMDQDPLNLSKVEGVMKRLEGLRTKLHLSAIKSHESMKTVLTPEQREKAKQMMKRHGREMH